MRLRGFVLFVAGLVIGTLVVPAAAQTDPAENQLVIRSDGFIFLLRGGQRHLVSPVALSDEEINGYPEGEPFLSGLVPVEAMSAAPAGSFGGTTFGGSSNSGSSSSGTRSAAPTRAPTSTPRTDSSAFEASFKTIPSGVEQNETLEIVLQAPNDATCEGKIQFKGGKTANFNSAKASKNECKVKVDIPDDARTGDADVKMLVKRGDQSVEFEDVVEIFAEGKGGTSSGDVKLEWDDFPDSVKQGERLEFYIKTEKGADCEGTIEFGDGEEEDLDDTVAKSNGDCKMEVDIPKDAKTGKANVIVRVKKDDEVSEDDKEIEIKKK